MYMYYIYLILQNIHVATHIQCAVNARDARDMDELAQWLPEAVHVACSCIYSQFSHMYMYI